MRRVFLAAALTLSFVAAACETGPSPTKKAEVQEEPSAEPERARALGGGGYNITTAKMIPGEPFDIETLSVSLEVINDSEQEVVPECIVVYGSQTALVHTNDQVVPPNETVWVSGQAQFLRPLDDYESGDAGCYTRLPTRLAREIERDKRLLAVGRATRVPDLVSRPLDAALPSFRRGLDVSILREETPCGVQKLIEMSRSYAAFGKPRCGGPVVVAQRPAPGTPARVGDEITITVAGKTAR